MRELSFLRTAFCFLGIYFSVHCVTQAETGISITDSSSFESQLTEELHLYEKPPSFRFKSSLTPQGRYRLFQTILHPMEFRKPIVSIPIEGRYGLGFYGMDGLNPFRFKPSLISYESDAIDSLQNNSITGRFGSFIEIDALQTNLSYYIFKKSYIDLITGLGFRYSSIFMIPTIELADTSKVTGPPEIPSSWGDINPSWGVTKTFTPVVMEGNIVTSLILQWHPKWFIHLKYSYGINRVRFYRDDSINSLPRGQGTTAAYSIGIKFIKESETAARYALGLELKHLYLRVSKIDDPDDVTPISAFKFPSFGLFFSISAFYGGQPTMGDKGKKLFLQKDYVSARRNFIKFIETYPDHVRIHRARKLVEICNTRIPYQLYDEGVHLEKIFKTDLALEKFVEASRTADESLNKILRRKIEGIAWDYMMQADSLFLAGETDEALKLAGKAAAVSERGQKSLRLLEAKVAIQKGEDLAYRGLYPKALEKFAEALKMAPSLKQDIRKNELIVVKGLLEDVNKANDEATLKLALYSLHKSREILKGSDEKIDGMITELEKQLALVQEYRVKQTMEEYMGEAREKIAERYLPRVELGMLVAEVQDILGDPHEVVERVDEKERNYQMWIYYLSENKKRLLYFENYILFKIEEE